VDRVSIERMCAGKEFQVEGADTEKAGEEKLRLGLSTLPAQYAAQGLCNGWVYVRPSVCLSVPSIDDSSLLLSSGGGGRYRSIATGAQTAAAGSVLLRSEARGST